MESKLKLLVVDDEESLRVICQDALEDEGYEVLTAEDGQEGLEILRKDSDIALVVSDLKMPRLNGIEFLRQAKKEGLEADFLITTGFGTIEVAVECIRLGAADYLPKPFNISHLLIKVKKVLQERERRLEQKRLSNVVRILNLSNALNRLQNLDSILEEFIYHLQRNFNPDGIIVGLYSQGNLRPRILRGAVIRRNYNSLFLLLHKMEEALKAGKTLWDNSFSFKDKQQVFSLVVTPLIVQKEKVGVTLLLKEAGKDEQLLSTNKQLISIFCNHAASSLQNAWALEKLNSLNLDIMHSYAKAVEAKDYYTKGHSDNVARYALNFARFLRLEERECELLYVAGVLHDIGKIGIPDNILNKPGKLTQEEFEVMKKHPVIAREILGKVESLKDVIPLVYHHHERVDGKGYPEGLRGDQLTLPIKMLSVVDAFEAMTSDRSYRKALPLDKVQEIMDSGVGSQWEEELVRKWFFLVEKKGMEGVRDISGFKGMLKLIF